MKLHRGKAAARAGYALVLFVMIFFGLMGLAALVIDMGFARLAQQEMQTAVDSAALEGLRFRDVSTDQARRQQASQMVGSLFSPYVDASGGTVQYGAGVEFSGFVGPSDLAAAQTMVVPSTPVYQPTGLELNLSDATEGDMSAGTYGANPNYDPTQSADEDGGYNRRDFTPSAGTAAASAPAFLVRMRRTNNSSGLDQESGSGISSGGPALPLLFGRGSLMARSGTGNQLSVTTGITVRATAIAAAGDGITFSGTSGTYSAGRAKSAGPPYQGPDASGNAVNIPGTTPFSITASAWSSMTVGTAQAFQSSGGTGEVQWFGAPPTGVIQIGQLAPLPVGTTTLAATTGTAAIATNKGYVPISNTYYDESNNAYNVIIGFGYAGWNWDGTTLSLTKLASAPVGWGNVSAALVGVVQPPTDPKGNPVLTVSTLFSDHVNLVTNPLYAPVLVNHYIGPPQSNP
ncbi:MAG: TadE/TadG family type IV pilus assembly protein [Thermoguttaceae bacterium]